jgi:hypothetical protein
MDGTRLSSRPSNREKVPSERRQTRDGTEARCVSGPVRACVLSVVEIWYRSFNPLWGADPLVHLSLLVCAVVLLRYAVALLGAADSGGPGVV